MKSPYVFFGGKASVADVVWQRLGDVPMYIEPFFGSGAVLLNRPHEPRVETVNDKWGMISNFWRALQAEPETVAKWADWPALENDLHARHAWLVERKDSLQERLEGDPDYYDAKIAGWWCWGMALWIGSGFCSGDGSWVRQDGKLVKVSNAGQGVQRQLVHLSDAGQGVQRQLVHLGDAGRGDAGSGECGLYAWMEALAERMRRVRVCCGDWTRVCGGKDGDSLAHFFACGEPCGIFLDPPYADTAGREANIYTHDDLQVAHAVREWAIAHGDDPRLRIALCGYEGEHLMPDSWEKLEWKAHGGMQWNGKANANTHNRFRERIWFSPFCEKAIPEPQQEFAFNGVCSDDAPDFV